MLNNKMTKLSHKRQVAVQEYCANGFNWVQAMLSAGYTESYANKLGYKLLENMGVAEAIRAILDERQLKTGYNRERAEQMLADAYDTAKTKSDSSAMTSACRELNALFGLRQESGQQQSLVISVSERPEHSPEQPGIGQDGQTVSEPSQSTKTASEWDAAGQQAAVEKAFSPKPKPDPPGMQGG